MIQGGKDHINFTLKFICSDESQFWQEIETTSAAFVKSVRKLVIVFKYD